MRKFCVVLSIVAVLTIDAVHAGNLFACKQGNGTVKIQAQACETGQIGHVQGAPTRAETEYLADESMKARLKKSDEDWAEREKKKKECAEVFAQGTSLIGKDIWVVMKACGGGDRKNTTQTARGTYVQRVYKNNYVYTADDIITSIQGH